jgi:hypothetical protein
MGVTHSVHTEYNFMEAVIRIHIVIIVSLRPNDIFGCLSLHENFFHSISLSLQLYSGIHHTHRIVVVDCCYVV